MKALILVGGYGTRMRPLTLSVPKPLIQFCNKSIVEHQISALVQAGVDHVVLAVAYQPSAMMEALKELEAKFNVRISCSCENEPLGTAGPIRLASDLLMQDGDESDSFFVFNSDVICDFPLTKMLAFHKSHGAEGTILVTQVENPSAFGVVVAEPSSGKIQRFVEKPKEFVGDCINAGLYLLRKSAINRIELRPTSIEKEIFPSMAGDGQLYAMKLDGYWADIGQPKDFLSGMHLYLDSVRRKWPCINGTVSPRNGSNKHEEEPRTPHLSDSEGVVGNVLIADSAKIGKGCLIGPDVTIGPNCVIGDGVRLQRCAIMENVTVDDGSFIEGSILGWQSRIGRWVRIEGLTVVGQDVKVVEECYINGAFILPHKTISSSIREPGAIIM